MQASAHAHANTQLNTHIHPVTPLDAPLIDIQAAPARRTELVPHVPFPESIYAHVVLASVEHDVLRLRVREQVPIRRADQAVAVVHLVRGKRGEMRGVGDGAAVAVFVVG